MKTVPLGELVDIKGGGTPPKDVEAYWGGDIPWASVKDFKSSEIANTVDSITPEGVANSATNIIPANSILVPTRMAVGKAAINTIPMAINQDLKALTPRKGTDLRYLLYALLGKAPELEKQATGATVKGITLEVLKSLKIPLPPLEEQKRIAAILDQADELRRKRQRALDRLNQLGQAIFIEMFGDPITNPMGWRVTHLGEIVRDGDKINYGVVQPGDEVESGVPLIRVGDLLKPFIDRSLVKQIDPAIESNYARSRLAGDEILIGCVGSIGAVALAHPGLEGANIARAVARVPADDSKADRRFLAAMIRSPLVQRYFTAETRTVAQPTLNIGLIVQAPILLPPLELQRQFSHTLDRIEPIAKALVSGTVASDRLFTSLQHRAFSGELTASSLGEAAA